MGCIFGTNSQTNDSPRQDKYKSSSQSTGHAKTRVNDTDKAILDVKARLRKLKTYVDKLNIQCDQQQAKIQDLLKQKNKDRALIALKHKKFIEKELDKAMGAQTMLETTIRNIESAAIDVEVYEALKKGDQIITELQQKASLEDFEELYEKHQENQERMKMEQELFGQVLNDEDLEDELAKLDEMIALEAAEAIPEAGSNPLKEPLIQQQKQHSPQKQEQSNKRVAQMA